MDKIVCVGKNYLKHALELGDAVPEQPLFFIKPPSTICDLSNSDDENTSVVLPATGEIHHEVELVLRISSDDGQWIFSNFTFGIDLTVRDLQQRLKKAGQPWEKAKVFKNSSILGTWHPLTSMNDLLEIPFCLKVNGEVRQRASGAEMRWKPEELLREAARFFPLCDGDLLFTGTPQGVGPLATGDVVEVQGGPVLYCFKVTHG